MTSIKEALTAARDVIQITIDTRGVDCGGFLLSSLNKVGSALAQLDSADAVSSTTLARDWKTIEEQIASATPTELFSLFRDYLVMNSTSGDDLAPLYIARITAILSTGLLPDASPGNGAEKVREALQIALGVMNGNLLTASRERNYAKAAEFEDYIKTLEAALHSTSAAGETTSSDGGVEGHAEGPQGHSCSREPEAGNTASSGQMTPAGIKPGPSDPSPTRSEVTVTCGLDRPSESQCPNMKEVGGGMDGERYSCAVCGKGYYLDYDDMR